MSSRDTTSLYMPEEFTHLFHTPAYQKLSDDERSLYNRLYSLRINEQFFTFEELFIQKITQRFHRHHAFRHESELLESIALLKHEEEQHSLMFRAFNRRSSPDIYSGRDTFFARLTFVEDSLLAGLVRFPGLDAALIFLMLAMEELTTAISTAILNHPSVNELDHGYVDLHRRHLLDEKRHVGIDVIILKKVIAHTPARLLALNARVFHHLFRTILKPRRSTIRVIEHLAGKSCKLAGLKREMINAVRALDTGSAFPGILAHPSSMPVMYSMFENYRDFNPARESISTRKKSAHGSGA